jgi:hypothetical protein
MPVIVVPRGALLINARMAFDANVRIAALTNYGDPFAHISAMQDKVLPNRDTLSSRERWFFDRCF